MIERFTDEWRPLSNFWPARVNYDGVSWPTVEHAYQAAKTNDPTERERIAATRQPGMVKRQSRFLTLRADWEEVKLEVMRELIRQKFTVHHELREFLLATGEQTIVEGNNWHDNFWGACLCGRCRGGLNHLGLILMATRRELANRSEETA